MTPVLLRARLEGLRELDKDAPQTVGAARRVLYREVLRTIADGHAQDPRELAQMALVAERIGTPRGE